MRDINYIDKRVSLIISLQVFLLGSKNCLIQGIPFLFLVNDTLNLIIMGLVGILYVYALWITKKRRLSGQCIMFWAFILLSYGFTYLVFPQNVPFIKETILRVVTILFLTSILIAKLRDFCWLKKYMTMFAYPTVIAGVISAYFISYFGHITSSDYEGNEYAISLSYAVLMAVMWLLHDFFKNRTLFALIFALVGIIIIILYGSRNPLLAIVSYLFFEIYDIAEHSRNKARRAIYRAVLFLSAIIGVFYKQVILLFLKLASGLGFNSRTLQLLSEDSIDQSNRDTIHEQLWNIINEHPLTGLGIQGDIANMEEMAHGLYINIISTYGYIIGSLFLVYLFINCITALKKARGLDHQVLVVFLCLVIPRGFTGGDMWQSDIFWWLMAIIFVILSKKYNNDGKRIFV